MVELAATLYVLEKLIGAAAVIAVVAYIIWASWPRRKR